MPTRRSIIRIYNYCSQPSQITDFSQQIYTDLSHTQLLACMKISRKTFKLSEFFRFYWDHAVGVISNWNRPIRTKLPSLFQIISMILTIFKFWYVISVMCYFYKSTRVIFITINFGEHGNGYAIQNVSFTIVCWVWCFSVCVRFLVSKKNYIIVW